MIAGKTSDTTLLKEAIRILGDEWTMMITHMVYFGASRFDHFMSVLPISRPRLSERLRSLVGIGILKKNQYLSRPARYEYLFTDMGHAIHPVAVSLVDWARTWRPSNQGVIDYQGTHGPCGAPLSGVLICSACSEVIEPQTLVEESPAACQWCSGIDSLVSRWSRVKNSKLFESPMDPAMRALKVMGDRWTPQIMDRILVGIQRFEGIQSALGVSRNILADRLAHMENEELIIKQAYMTNPYRYNYVPTKAGLEMHRPLALLREWARTWRLDQSSDARLIHTSCGQVTSPTLVCATCSVPILAEDTVDIKRDLARTAFENGQIRSGGSLLKHLEDRFPNPNDLPR